jgi:hypothetical protein
VMTIPTPSPHLVTPRGLPLTNAEKAEALSDSLEAKFQAVTAPTVAAVIQMVDAELESYFQAPCQRTYDDQP